MQGGDPRAAVLLTHSIICWSVLPSRSDLNPLPPPPTFLTAIESGFVGFIPLPRYILECPRLL